MRAVMAWALVLLQLVAPVAIGEARAQAAAPVSAEEAALAHLDRGIAAYHAGEYERARREFDAARALVPGRPNPYRWLGLAEVQLGDCGAARVAFERFLALVPEDDPRVPEVQRLRRDCQRLLPAAHATVAPRDAGAPLVPAPEPTPVTRRWWFWAAIGVVAVATAGLAIGLAQDGDDTTLLPPIACGSGGCAPGSAP